MFKQLLCNFQNVIDALIFFQNMLKYSIVVPLATLFIYF